VRRKTLRMDASRRPLSVVMLGVSIAAVTRAVYVFPPSGDSTATRPVMRVVWPENPPRVSGTKNVTDDSPGTMANVPVGSRRNCAPAGATDARRETRRTVNRTLTPMPNCTLVTSAAGRACEAPHSFCTAETYHPDHGIPSPPGEA
jgi:hypothetical protein